MVKFQGMLPNSGRILRVVHFWEVAFAQMLSPGWWPDRKVVARHARLEREAPAFSFRVERFWFWVLGFGFRVEG